jgi:glyoxylase-like metal-dependent hydrolase (beta-lactamase superfamily II)
VPGVTAIKVGGHFEGSMVLHWDGHLFIADTFVNVPVSFQLSPKLLSRCRGLRRRNVDIDGDATVGFLP